MVGGFTTKKHSINLRDSNLKNKVYIGDQQILDGKDTNPGFTDKDIPRIEKNSTSSKHFSRSDKAQNFSLIPSNPDPYRSQEMKTKVEAKLTEMNKGLTPPQDALARLENGEIVIDK